MRKIGLLYATLLLALFLTGCIPPSLQPLYTEDTIVFDEQLLGKWYDEEGGIWSFTKNDDQAYELRVIEDDGKQAFFEVHLVQLGEHRFIDLYPGENMDLENTAETYKLNLVPAHTFMKVQLAEPNLLVQWVFLGELIEDDPNLIKHEIVDGDTVLITAQSEDLQRVILEHLDKVVNWDDCGQLRRCPKAFSQEDVIYDEALVGQWESTDEDLYLDIVTWNDGYDVLVDGSDVQLHYKGLLYSFAEQEILGLYTLPITGKEEKAGLDKIPDILVQIQAGEPELKVHVIEWGRIEASLNNPLEPLIDKDSKPDLFFNRVCPGNN